MQAGIVIRVSQVDLIYSDLVDPNFQLDQEPAPKVEEHVIILAFVM